MLFQALILSRSIHRVIVFSPSILWLILFSTISAHHAQFLCPIFPLYSRLKIPLQYSFEFAHNKSLTFYRLTYLAKKMCVELSCTQITKKTTHYWLQPNYLNNRKCWIIKFDYQIIFFTLSLNFYSNTLRMNKISN